MEHNFHSLHCVYNGKFKVFDCLLTFSHMLYLNIWGPCGVHDRVIMGFALNRTACFSFFSILFYQLWGCVLYMLLGLFAIFLSNFGGASYTQAYTVGGLDCCVITTEYRTRVQ